MIDLEKESTDLVAKIISQFVTEKKPTAEMLSEVIGVIVTSYLKGKMDGLTQYAWWKDGTQYVGTCGTTLLEAIEDAKNDVTSILRDPS